MGQGKESWHGAQAADGGGDEGGDVTGPGSQHAALQSVSRGEEVGEKCIHCPPDWSY